MNEPSDLKVVLNSLDHDDISSVFPEHLNDKDLFAFLKFSTELAADEVFWMEADSKIFYVNNAACKKLGYERSELIGMRVWEWDPLFPKEVWPTFWKDLKEKKHIDFETKHQNKSGKVFPVRIKGHFVEYGNREILFAFVSDISDIKNKEAKLQQHSAELESLVESRTAELDQEKEKFEKFVNLAPVGIAINSLEDGKFIYVNSEFSRFTGYGVDELNSMDYWQLTPKKYEKQEEEQLTSMAEMGRYGPYQKEYIHRDGHYYPVLLLGIKITDKDGQDYIWSVIQDISEQKKSEEKLREAKQNAEAAAKVKSEFLANMSHEIRTPMNGIVGLTNLLLASSLNAEQRSWAQGLKASTDLLLTIINDILDLSKIETGKLNIESVPFDLAEILRQIEQPFCISAKNKSITFSITTTGFEQTQYIGDPTRIKQVISNLTNNAIKFTDKGSVSLKVEVGQQNTDNTYQVLFTVSDTGIGIPEDRIERLFQRFSQADNSTTRRFGGTGLGLSICKQLVEMMGGEIGCESTPGEGSKFWFSLALKTATDHPENDSASHEDSQTDLKLGDLKVLLVEDVVINQIVAIGILEELGIQPDVAENGREAVEKVASNKYDIVFMDCHMPVMDGFEATTKIRNLPAGKNLPIIAITAGAMQEEQLKCLDCGMNGVITKPFEPKDITDAIASLGDGTTFQWQDG